MNAEIGIAIADSSMGQAPGFQINEKIIQLGEYSLQYATGGAGDTIIMLHGSDRQEDWKLWQPLLPLSQSFRLVIPDLIGHGGSSKPRETPAFDAQARVIHDLMELMSIKEAALVGYSWGGQIALEVGIRWRDRVKALVLIASTYDKAQLPKLKSLRIPTLILWAQDDMITQLKAGYLLRDAIGSSRLELLGDVWDNPKLDFTSSHKIVQQRGMDIMERVVRFLKEPTALIQEPPELEPELRGLALKAEDKENADDGGSAV